jgi:hypothetical protein
MAHPVFASMPSRLIFSRPHHVQMKMPPHLLPTRQTRSSKQIRYSFHHNPNLDRMASPWDASCLVTNLPSQSPRPSSSPSIANRRSAHTAHLSLPSAPRASIIPLSIPLPTSESDLGHHYEHQNGCSVLVSRETLTALCCYSQRRPSGHA